MSGKKTNLEALKQRIAALPPEKRAIFEQQLKEKNLQIPQQTIPKRQNYENIPLSLAQERLWFLHQLDPESPAYNIAIAWQFTGSLDHTILEKSFNTIIKRHESLKTRFMAVEGNPIVEIIPNLTLTVPKIDLQQLPEKKREKEVKYLENKAAKQPFNLAEDLLLRVWLLQLSPQKSTVLVVLHHIIADGWSRGILLKELATVYKAFSSGESVSLPELSIQYSDFAAWQRQWLAGEELQAHLDYWKKQLANVSVLNLPTDYPRPHVPTLRGGIQSFTLDKALTNALKTLSRQQGVTLFMTLLTAFKILLHRYSGQNDIVVGSPIANRNWAETEPLIGFFVNTLVLRSDLSGNPSFVALLKQVKQTTSQAYQHQDLPFAKLVDTLQPERDESHNPLFQVMFQVQNEAYQLQNALSPELAIPGLSLSQSWIDTQSTKFDMTWHLVERETGLLAVVEYSLDLFEAEMIARMLGHFQVLLRDIISKPQAHISELSLLTEKEEKQLLLEWNKTETKQLENIFISQLFEAQVEKTPNNIAVTSAQQQLTYRELNSKANQLAHYLQTLGVKPEVKVGILMERSPDLLIAILGVLKAGSAYVPIDPTYPSERIAFMVEDAQIAVLLTETKTAISQTFPTSASKITLDQDWPLIASESQENSVISLFEDNLAYVIYTSGSTGKPKGTLITHGGLSNYLTWAIATYPVTEGCGSPVNSSIAFDATITSLLTPLLVGQKVILLPETGEIEALSEVFTQENLSLVKLTPAHLSILNSLLAEKEKIPQSHALIIGGEALSQHSLTFWQEKCPQTRLINEYGPTETVVGCCVYEVPSQVSQTENVPIGRPIANTELYILDQYLQPTPIGVPGELYIGGVGVARGYFNRPDLTAERFIPLPPSPPLLRGVGGIEGSRLYKTGDLARYLPDGTIEYLGRIDNQVKIRGFRIELGEIEGMLRQHPQVQEAIAVVQEDNNKTPRLVAYVVASSEPPDLRQFLSEKLPAYMVPTLFISLDAFPLTPNGKIDRQRFPVADFSQRNVKKSLIEPRTPQEATLTEIWRDVLGKMEVGVYDNFFELGGDSILGLQIIARANQAGLQLTPRQLFQCQTIAELASVANVLATTSAEQGMVTGSVPLTPIQHWFFEQQLPDPHHYNQTLLLEALPDLNPYYLEQALHHLLIHHDALRLRFTQQGEAWKQFYGNTDNNIPFSTINLENLSKKAQSLAIESICARLQTTLNLSEGLLVRGAWFDLGKGQKSRLLFVIHHLVVDSVSWRILLEDFVTVYQQLLHGELVKLPPKTTAYQTWANQLLNYSQSEGLDSDVWSMSEGVSLPTDYTSLNHNTVGSSDRISLTLSIEQTNALQEEVASAYHAQLNEVLLAALYQSISQWTGERSLIIDVEGHGREDIFETVNLSRTVGWFTVIFPVRLELKSMGSLGDVIKSVKEQYRQVAKQGINYGILRYLGRKILNKRSSSINFNYLGEVDRITTQEFISGLAEESTGWVRSPQGSRRYLLEITGAIAQKQLQLTLTYSQQIHRRETIEGLGKKVLSTLEAFIVHCQSSKTGGYTPSDFASANLDQKQLDQFLGKLKQSVKKLK
ncbi:peptide synthetase [Crocosphaera subtropica ATCC 51142]|uniref:Peptide synthetase n=1 Tax=Crocosphaera subtropica (strain ATCC 51142 / BH68) TaxID=43989 RepID=B1WWS9_CROS5|nr:non-ribosomal peptide synthetase [Crocosphaera subtropica]ACB52398.1 peptide synthetase [Crocosphaera subtropica ATCC 51142]